MQIFLTFKCMKIFFYKKWNADDCKDMRREEQDKINIVNKKM